MFFILLPLLSIRVVEALAVPVLLETTNPTLVASSVDDGVTPLNMTALWAADANVTVAETEDVDDVNYTVPGTQTTLHIGFRRDRPLHWRSLGGYLLLMDDQVRAHISASGDGWLSRADDPYRRNWPGSYLRSAQPNPMTDGRMQGFYFIAKSSPLPVSEGEAHLTYGIMSDVLKGLFNIMYLGVAGSDPFPFGCYCNIEDGTGGTGDLVGTAVIWAAPINLEIP